MQEQTLKCYMTEWQTEAHAARRCVRMRQGREWLYQVGDQQLGTQLLRRKRNYVRVERKVTSGLNTGLRKLKKKVKEVLVKINGKRATGSYLDNLKMPGST